VVAGGLTLWRLRGRSAPTARLPDVEVERRRVAAVDPSFDPAKPAGGIAGVVRDADARPVLGAVVAVTRNRGKDELPTFSQPVTRVAVTDGGGRFQLADVLPGEYGVTATAPAGAPAHGRKGAARARD